MSKDDDKIVGWFTTDKKQRVPIHEGETKEDAIDRAFNKREREIANNSQEAKSITNSKAAKQDKTFSEVNYATMEKRLYNAKMSRSEKDRWRVDEHTAKQFEERGCKCFVSSGGSTVVVDKNGDIISVCKVAGDTSVRGSDLIRYAVSMGGTKLDSFSGNHSFYVSCGFEPTSWTPFNLEFAPKGWETSGQPQEPVVFYRYVGVGNVRNTNLDSFLSTHAPYDDYDAAQAYRDSRIKSK